MSPHSAPTLLSMITATLLVLFALQLSAFDALSRQNYTNHKLYKVTVDNAEQLQRVRNHDLLDIWHETGREISVRVAPIATQSVLSFFATFHIKHDLLIDNVQAWIDEERLRNEIAPRDGQRERYNDVTRFRTFEEVTLITSCPTSPPVQHHLLSNLPHQLTSTSSHFCQITKYLKEQAEKYPNSTQLVSIGQTVEGRPIHLLKVSAAQFQPSRLSALICSQLKFTAEKRPIIWIDAGIHAREHISPATALYTLSRLLQAQQPGNDTDARELLETYHFYVVPVLNPDGYVHTWTKDRLWRKNRAQPKARPFRAPWNMLTDCIGTSE